jgi:hypothetical protein
MIHKARIAEEEESIASESTRGSTDVSSDLDALSLGTTGSSAMSTVYGSSISKEDSNRSSSRPSSPSRSHSSGLFHKRRNSSQASVDAAKQKRDDHLARWLTAGNVIYKSVGLGLMDLVVGMDIIKLAKERGVGSHLENFS